MDWSDLIVFRFDEFQGYPFKVLTLDNYRYLHPAVGALHNVLLFRSITRFRFNLRCYIDFLEELKK